MRSILFAGAVIFALSAAARADGLIYRLPDDGVSATFELDVSGKAGDMEQSATGSMKISSVGTTTIDGETCRWIEFKTALVIGGQQQTVIAKALVPEKHIGKGKSPGDHVVRGWVKHGSGQAIELKDLKSSAAGPLISFLAGPAKEPKEIETAEIDSKLGKQSCAGVAGTLDVEQDGHPIALTYENRLHEKAPFGVVASTWKFDRKNKDGQIVESGTFKLKLTDMGAQAKSELPDND